MSLRKTIFCVIASLLLVSGAIVEANAQYDREQFLFRGRRALMEGKYIDAINNFNILLRLDDGLYEAYFFRGIAKYNLGDFAGAELDFDKAIEMNPIYTLAYHYRAITRSRTGKYDLAIKDLEEAVDLRPNYTGLYFSRGVTYFLSQQFEKAVEDFNRFIRNEPKEPDAYLNRGASYLFLGDTLKALEDYGRAITLDSFEPEGYIRRSRIYFSRNEPEKALEDLNEAVRLDTANTFAYFNRALVKYELKDLQGALDDFEEVLKREPGNALTLYNRALLRTQIGDYNNALDDYDRVLNINPDNVLAYYNRSILFIELGRYDDAIDDLSRAIALYPDFAKAYMNRSYVKNLVGDRVSAEQDYRIAQQKIARYRAVTSDSTGRAAFADTSKKYDNLLALDSDFAKRDFNDELLQNSNVAIDLKPLYRFVLTGEVQTTDLPVTLAGRYEDPKVEEFKKSVPLEVELASETRRGESPDLGRLLEVVESAIGQTGDDKAIFAKALIEAENKQFNSALLSYEDAIAKNPEEMFYYLNRGALQAEMIDFISSIESNVQVLTLDNAGTAKARVNDGSTKNYDYTAAIMDMAKAASIYPEFPYVYYNMGNLLCLSNEFPQAIEQYTKAIGLYPGLAEAYYNRGLVLIYVKDKEKGCIDMSKAGELGISDAYRVIGKYCDPEK